MNIKQLYPARTSPFGGGSKIVDTGDGKHNLALNFI